MISTTQHTFTLPDNFERTKVQDAPLIYLIVASKQHYDYLHEKSYRNAFEQTLYDGLCSTNIISIYNTAMEFVSNNTNLDQNNQDVMNVLTKKLPHSIFTWESHGFLSAEQGKIGAVCAAIDQRLKFINDRLFGRTFSKEVAYEGNNSDWILNNFVPFIQSLNTLTENMTLNVRECLRRAQEEARKEMETRRNSNYRNHIMHSTVQHKLFPTTDLPGSFVLNGTRCVKASTPHGIMIVPIVYNYS